MAKWHLSKLAMRVTQLQLEKRVGKSAEQHFQLRLNETMEAPPPPCNEQRSDKQDREPDLQAWAGGADGASGRTVKHVASAPEIVPQGSSSAAPRVYGRPSIGATVLTRCL